MKLNEPQRQISKAETLAIGQACRGTDWLRPGLTGREPLIAMESQKLGP